MYQLRGKNIADSVATYGRGRELFRPPMYLLVLQIQLAACHLSGA